MPHLLTWHKSSRPRTAQTRQGQVLTSSLRHSPGRAAGAGAAANSQRTSQAAGRPTGALRSHGPQGAAGRSRSRLQQICQVVVEGGHVAVVVLDRTPQDALLGCRHKGDHRLVANGSVLRLALSVHLRWEGAGRRAALEHVCVCVCASGWERGPRQPCASTGARAGCAAGARWAPGLSIAGPTSEGARMWQAARPG